MAAEKHATHVHFAEVTEGAEGEFLKGWIASAQGLSREPGLASLELRVSLDAEGRPCFATVSRWCSPEDFDRATSLPALVDPCGAAAYP